MSVCSYVFQKFFIYIYTKYFNKDCNQSALADDTKTIKTEWVKEKKAEKKKQASKSTYQWVQFPEKTPEELKADNGLYDYLFKFLIIGDSRIGKSFLLLRFTEHTYLESYINGAVYGDFKIRTISHDDRNIKLQVWDTGKELLKPAKTQEARARGIIVAYDVTDQESFNSVTSWLLDARCVYNLTTPLILVGTKSDLNTKRQVDYETGEELAKEYGIPFIETSAKAATNVEKAFLILTNEVVKGMIPKKESKAVGQDPFAQANVDSTVFADMIAIANQQVGQNYLLQVNNRITLFGAIDREARKRDTDLDDFEVICKTAQSSDEFVRKVIELRNDVKARHKLDGLSGLIGITRSNFANCLDDALKAMLKKAPANGHFALAYREHVTPQRAPVVSSGPTTVVVAEREPERHFSRLQRRHGGGGGK